MAFKRFQDKPRYERLLQREADARSARLQGMVVKMEGSGTIERLTNLDWVDDPKDVVAARARELLTERIMFTEYRFALEYLVHLNEIDAYMATFSTTRAVAQRQAGRFLSRPKVQLAIAQAYAKIGETFKINKEALIGKAWMLANSPLTKPMEALKAMELISKLTGLDPEDAKARLPTAPTVNVQINNTNSMPKFKPALGEPIGHMLGRPSISIELPDLDEMKVGDGSQSAR